MSLTYKTVCEIPPLLADLCDSLFFSLSLQWRKVTMHWGGRETKPTGRRRGTLRLRSLLGSLPSSPPRSAASQANAACVRYLLFRFLLCFGNWVLEFGVFGYVGLFSCWGICWKKMETWLNLDSCCLKFGFFRWYSIMGIGFCSMFSLICSVWKLRDPGKEK